ncbi:entericidin A/B family lipoprotein [uncultured Oceanisphaera sp.]|nr:entericidin A/B family lipoprotein [uncultured Oceanisphaera sp.]
MVKILLATLISIGLAVGLAGCNTFAGAGKDIQQGGEAVEEAARDVQSNY